MSVWNPHNPVTVSLRRVLHSASFVGCADIHATDITERSGDCSSHALFAAIPGTHTDGTNYVQDAVANGAPAVLVNRPLADATVPQCVVPDVRSAYAKLCASLADNPCSHLKLAGVTGTNGKSTVTWLIRSILNQAGERTGVLGTIEYHDGLQSEPASLTTPDTRTVFQWLGRMVDRGANCAAMEISSHALDQNRVSNVLLDAAVVTNITQDHFDYHGSYDAYRAAKAKIVHLCRDGGAVVLNLDDAGSESLLEMLSPDRRTITYGLAPNARLAGRVLNESMTDSRFLMTVDGRKIAVRTRLVGRHNVSNCLAAAAVAWQFGVPLEQIASGIEALAGVPGRLEHIDCGQPFRVFVDYAHTPDALGQCLSHLKPLTRGKLLCVFGAGGDRDSSKRPLLGRAATQSDLAIVTSDNPRSEAPDRIISDVTAGVDAAACDCHVEPDREKAIRWAIDHAGPDDCLVVAGKGHETEQVIGTKRIHFDDREVIRRCLGQVDHTTPPTPHIFLQTTSQGQKVTNGVGHLP